MNDGRRLCGATNRQGQPCRAIAMRGRHRCRLHGGKSLAGPAHPAFRHGRHSKVLPMRMVEDFQRAVQDPARLELTEAIALVQARIFDILKRVDTGESSRIWFDLELSYDALLEAVRAGDVTATQRALYDHGRLIKRGKGDWGAWADVMNLLERKRKLVESERKRLADERQVITVEQAMALLGLLADAVRRHVHDPAAVQAVTDEYLRLTGVGADMQC